jgi:hypothetical protein
MEVIWNLLKSEALWAAITALATVVATAAIFCAARQLRFNAWLKAQEIFVREEFTDARGRVLRHLQDLNAEWDSNDRKAAYEVCRRMDEFCRLSPYFALTKRRGQKKVLKVWADPIAKSWALLRLLVEGERLKVGWPTKWDAFEKHGEAALKKIPKDQREKLNKVSGIKP